MTAARATLHLRGRGRAGAACLVVIVGGILVASSVLFVWPATNRPQKADGVLSLDGPGEPVRERTAIWLVEHGYAHVLLFSQGAYRSTPCPVVRGAKVVCFVPVPGRTVGEVEFGARYARLHGWHSLIIVPGHEQVTRARILMERCFKGRVLVVAPPAQLLEVPYQVAYEWAALAKALLVDTTC